MMILIGNGVKPYHHWTGLQFMQVVARSILFIVREKKEKNHEAQWFGMYIKHKSVNFGMHLVWPGKGKLTSDK